MCYALGNEPINEEIPIEFDDLPSFVQKICQIYSLLPDTYHAMEGSFLGKEYIHVFRMLELHYIDQDDHLFCLKLFKVMDDIRIGISRSEAEQRASLNSSKTNP